MGIVSLGRQRQFRSVVRLSEQFIPPADNLYTISLMLLAAKGTHTSCLSVYIQVRSELHQRLHTCRCQRHSTLVAWILLHNPDVHRLVSKGVDFRCKYAQLVSGVASSTVRAAGKLQRQPIRRCTSLALEETQRVNARSTPANTCARACTRLETFFDLLHKPRCAPSSFRQFNGHNSIASQRNSPSCWVSGCLKTK